MKINLDIYCMGRERLMVGVMSERPPQNTCYLPPTPSYSMIMIIIMIMTIILMIMTIMIIIMNIMIMIFIILLAMYWIYLSHHHVKSSWAEPIIILIMTIQMIIMIFRMIMSWPPIYTHTNSCWCC